MHACSADLNRLFWHSRRGMRELDLLLVPFVRHAYPHLSAPLQHAYQQLVAQEDQTLYNWLIKGEPVEAVVLQAIIAQVLAHAQPSSPTLDRTD